MKNKECKVENRLTIFFIFLLITLLLSIARVSHGDSSKYGPYCTLFQRELSEISPIYENKSRVGFEIYKEAKE